MAKYTASFHTKGLLNREEMTIIEAKKDEEMTYDLDEQLRHFDGKVVTISIKEEYEIDPIEEN